MIIDSAEKFFAVFNECDARSLYEAAKHYAKFHKNYLSENVVDIDKTSLTMMEKIFAQTKLTPEEEINDMRKKREEAIEHFCYIYGGYIAWKLKLDWERNKFFDIVEKSTFISLATEQVVAALIRKLKKDGYKKGTFSHLVNRSIKNKAKDVADKYARWKKHNSHISFENAEEIIGGVIDIVDDNGSDSEFEIDFDEKEFEAAAILQILKQVKTKNSADDYNMFILYRVKNYKLEDIAKKFDISISTASRRITDFANAAKELYTQYLNDMENY